MENLLHRKRFYLLYRGFVIFHKVLSLFFLKMFMMSGTGSLFESDEKRS